MDLKNLQYLSLVLLLMVKDSMSKSIERSTQNIGVSLKAKTLKRSSSRDEAKVVDIVSFYGVLIQIILLDCYVHQIPLFRCD